MIWITRLRDRYHSAPKILVVGALVVALVALYRLLVDTIGLLDGSLRPLSSRQITEMISGDPRKSIVVIAIFALFVFGVLAVSLIPLALIALVFSQAPGSRILLGAVSIIYLLAGLAAGSPDAIVSSVAVLFAWIGTLMPSVGAYMRGNGRWSSRAH